MTEIYSREQFDADKKAKEQQEAKAEQERREAMLKEDARQDWISVGGSEEGFEAAWPELRTSLLMGDTESG